MTEYKVRDIGLAEEGRLLIDYAEKHMPVLMHLREKYAESKPWSFSVDSISLPN